MMFPIRKVIYTFIFNFSLLLLLMIGIQNSSNKRKVNFIISETVNLPVSFIIGISFITGSITATLLTQNPVSKKE